MNYIIRLSKRKHYAHLFEKNKLNLNKTWQTINDILGRNRKVKLPQFILKNGKQISDEKEMADSFNSYFTNVGASVANDVQSTSHHFSEYLNPRTSESLFFNPTSECEIIQIVKDLKSSSSCGYDGISTNVVKKIIHYISYPLKHIFNLSLSTGVVPDNLKRAKIIPVYKKNDPNLTKNYRPISLLPTLSKILERIIFKRLYSHLSRNSILTKYQFGFRPNHSTEMALLHALEHITSCLDKKRIYFRDIY